MEVILVVSSVIILCFVLGILFADGQTVQFVPFKPDIYPDDSRVFSLEDIGELPSTSSPPYSSTELGNVLVCRTDRSPCCATQPNRFGEWTHNNTNISHRGRNDDYFRTRDDDQQIHLSRRAMYSGTRRTGEICCEFPDANSVTQRQCVEIVSTSLSVTISSSGIRLVGETYSLTCSASVSSGGSVNRIVWLRGTTTEMEMNSVSTLTLTFQPLSASDDGSYTCRVEVGNLVKINSIELEVFTSNSISSVTITPSGPSLTAGADSLTLACSATITAGTPSFSWTGPESRGPIAGTAVQQGSTTFTDTFVLGRVKESHRGTFTCQVSVTSTLTAEVSVTVAVQVPSISVSITGSGDGDAVALHSYTLTCSVTAPATLDLTSPSYRWIRDGVMLSGETSQTFVFTPLGTEVNSVYMYTCQYTATSPYLNNNVDGTSPGHRISIIDPTVRSPNSISVTDTSSSAVSVQWMFLEPISVTHKETCIVMFGETSGSLDSRSPAVTADGGRLTFSVPLNSLVPGTDYKYVIHCWNKFDSVGITTAEMSFRTSDSESGPVRGLATTSPSDSTLVISWSSPAMPNGVITYFLVRINDLDTTSDGEVTNYTASGLVAGVPYTVSVAAVNMAGTGRFIVTVVFTRELEPSISPKDIEVVRISGSMMRVSWTSLTLTEARGFITHYTVAYFPLSSGSKREELNILYQTVSKDSSEATIEGLDGYSAYVVQVSASTVAGAGGYSRAIIASTHQLALGSGGGGGGFGVGAITGAVVVTVVAIIVILILIVVIVVLAKRRSVSIRTDPPTCSTDKVCEYEEIKLKEGSSTHKAVVPSGAPSVKPPVEIGVDHCPAYGVITSPNLGLRDGPGDVDGTQSEGVYETVKQ